MSKTLIISGASRGIGLATAECFLRANYRVICLSRSTPPNPGIEHIQVDFRQPDWNLSLPETSTWLGDAEIVLIHNASVLRKDSIRDAATDLANVLQINVVAAQQLNELVLPSMQKGSSILYIGSTLSEKAVANTLSYSLSKHAVIGLMRATCQDLIGTGIHTVAVCPGFTDTEMLRSHLGHDEDIISSIKEGVSFGRLVDPNEIAETLWFCATHPVINGAIIHANLGQVES